MARPKTQRLPAVGTVVLDTARQVFAEFRGVVDGNFYLRPIGGGREWEVSPEFVKPATAAERRRAGV